jgi:hypothetical protein
LEENTGNPIEISGLLEEAMITESRQPRGPDLAENGDIVRQIIEAIRSVRFGQVQIIIQDSRVVQIDKTEKVRLT